MDYPRLGPAIREARRTKGLTQTQLKNQVGCSQSQISELEQGIHNAVSRDILISIANVLGLNLEEFERQESAAVVEACKYAFCTNPACPAARPFVIGGIPRMRPHIVALGGGARNCEYCGEVLTPRCERPGCGFPVHPGFYCRGCGKAYIELPSSIQTPQAAEARARQVDEFLRQFEA